MALSTTVLLLSIAILLPGRIRTSPDEERPNCKVARRNELSEADEKLTLEILFETECPYSVQFVANSSYEALKKFKGKLSLDVYTFGFSELDEDDITKLNCHHGPLECEKNRLLACVHKRAKENKDETVRLTIFYEQLELFRCILLSQNATTIESCLNTYAKIMKIDDLSTCARGAESLDIYKENKSRMQGISHLPWVILNGTHISEAEEPESDLMEYICMKNRDIPWVVDGCDSERP